jgi:hypothetical protein
VQDTREKIPWDFSFFYACENQVQKKLDTGDYSIEGLEKTFLIERKRSTGEIAINFGSKWKTFQKELERTKPYRFKYVICEFPYSNLELFPIRSGIPQNKLRFIKISGNYLKSKINKIQEEYGIEFIFCNNEFEAQEKAIEIMEKIYEIIRSEKV